MSPEICTLGHDALLVRFAREASEAATACVQVMLRLIEEADLPHISEIAPALASVMVRFKGGTDVRSLLYQYLSDLIGQNGLVNCQCTSGQTALDHSRMFLTVTPPHIWPRLRRLPVNPRQRSYTIWKTRMCAFWPWALPPGNPISDYCRRNGICRAHRH